ncbi:IS30 family transposase [Actinokineospora diospyrosa]|uniref:IS30 family transposase n=1 Tax=Actinokineospora diospyrosa TaxID=103728 RepID=UPI0020A3B190
MAAERRAGEKLARPKPRKLESAGRLRDYVMAGLELLWSPQQIARKIRAEFPMDEDMRVSHETIYQTLFVQGKGELRRLLYKALRSGRARRVSPSRRPARHDTIVGMVTISERPKEAEDRAVPGFWEGDLILGSACKSQILTLVERQTRFVMLQRVPYDRAADRVAALLTHRMSHLPGFLKNSITWDQGSEMADHAKFTIATGMPVYFCDPHSPWQRGTNENTNGLLRTLGWASPTEKMNELLINHGGAPIT